jgi:hypothetical protein
LKQPIGTLITGDSALAAKFCQVVERVRTSRIEQRQRVRVASIPLVEMWRCSFLWMAMKSREEGWVAAEWERTAVLPGGYYKERGSTR